MPPFGKRHGFVGILPHLLKKSLMDFLCNVLRTVLYPLAEEFCGHSQASKLDLITRITNSSKLTLLTIFEKSSLVDL